VRGLRRQPEVTDEPRHVDLAVVHPAALRLPRHGIAYLVEPGAGDFRRHEVGRVDDAAACVIHEDFLTGFGEER